MIHNQVGLYLGFVDDALLEYLQLNSSNNYLSLILPAQKLAGSTLCHWAPAVCRVSVPGAADLTGRQVGRRRKPGEPADRPVPS
jgi:hypothetical protein